MKDDMVIKNGSKRELPTDKSEETEYRSEDFLIVFTNLAKAFFERDFPAIHVHISIIYTITLSIKSLPVAEFGN